MKLLELVELYAAERPLKHRTLVQLRNTVAAIEARLKRPATLEDLNLETVNAWLRKDCEGYTPKTMKGRRTVIGTLWKYAAHTLGLVPPPDMRRLRAVKVPVTIPVAWTSEEFAKLLVAAGATPKRFLTDLRVRRGPFLVAFLRVCYDTGLRRSDVYGLPTRWLIANRFSVLQDKTQLEIQCALSEPTRRAVEETHRDAPRQWLFADVVHRGTIHDLIVNACKAAGVPHGGAQKVRRTAATQVEIAYPGRAGQFLGHRTPGMAVRHYIDARQLATEPIRPPEIA